MAISSDSYILLSAALLPSLTKFNDCSHLKMLGYTYKPILINKYKHKFYPLSPTHHTHHAHFNKKSKHIQYYFFKYLLYIICKFNLLYIFLYVYDPLLVFYLSFSYRAVDGIL